MYIVLISYSFFFLYFLRTAHGYCNYQIPNIKEMVNGINIKPLPSHSRDKRSVPRNLRIYFDYMPSFEAYIGADEVKKTIMEPAKAQLENILRARQPINGILRVDRGCKLGIFRKSNGIVGCGLGCIDQPTCLGVEIPEKYLKSCVIINNKGDISYSGKNGDGVIDSDIVLLVTFMSCVGSTLAFAASCFSESVLDRPILGVVNLCSNSFVTKRNVKETIKIMQHEIVHALGFAVDKYAFYRNEDGTPIVPRTTFGWPNLGISKDKRYFLWNEKIIKNVNKTRFSIFGNFSKTMSGFVLKNVLEIAKHHFNCSTLTAVDLEDYGLVSSATSHFDEYLLENEMMTPNTNNGLDVLSKFTLAVLQDTGWYDVDYSKAGKLYYGKDKGCILANDGCFKYMEELIRKGKDIYPFCNETIHLGKIYKCSKDRRYYYYCNFGRIPYVPIESRYFRNLKGILKKDMQYYAGMSPYNEFCPTEAVFLNPSSICNDETSNKVPNSKNIISSYFGPDSLCVENDTPYVYSGVYYGASCQKYTLNADKTLLKIYIESKIYHCPSKYPQIHYLSDGKKVIIKCPKDIKILHFPGSFSAEPSLVTKKNEINQVPNLSGDNSVVPNYFVNKASLLRTCFIKFYLTILFLNHIILEI